MDSSNPPDSSSSGSSRPLLPLVHLPLHPDPVRRLISPAGNGRGRPLGDRRHRLAVTWAWSRIAINTAHELGHKRRTREVAEPRGPRADRRATSSSSTTAATRPRRTPEDRPAALRRELLGIPAAHRVGILSSAWGLEATRLDRLGSPTGRCATTSRRLGDDRRPLAP